MNLLLLVAVALAALLFIAVSATMNALFLSSLGRTPIECGLLAAVSLASDIVKAVLPVVIMRAIILRAWVQGGAAALMLAVVVALSLASGTGFAALTRGTVTASRAAQNDLLVARQRDLAEMERGPQRLRRRARRRSSRPISPAPASIGAGRHPNPARRSRLYRFASTVPMSSGCAPSWRLRSSVTT